MNQEILKAFIPKLAGVSLIAAVVWFMAVKPQVDRLQELRYTRASQLVEITQGEAAIASLASDVRASVEQMDTFRDELILQLTEDHTLNAHEFLQDAAEKHNLTVSRIEPLRTSVATQKNDLDQSEIKLETKEFRVEFVGSFGGIVGYLEDLSNGIYIAKIDSFRMVPISRTDARMVLQVSIFQFVETPKIFSEFSTPPSAKKTTAGGDHDDL